MRRVRKTFGFGAVDIGMLFRGVREGDCSFSKPMM